jgi:hypothetical protein
MKTYLSQTHDELVSQFLLSTMRTLTLTMRGLEESIAREQAYIKKHGDANDASPDSQWEDYKIRASDNLFVWDAAKEARDKLKV